MRRRDPRWSLEFADHVLYGEPLPLNLTDAVQNMAYVDDAYRAAGMDPR